MITQNLIQDLKKIVSTNLEKNLNKNCLLKFKIIDNLEGIDVQLISSETKINPSNEFMQQIKSLAGVEFMLN